ncbi:MAG: hypothetical protein JEZ12_03730 [Desulfobacterium sp.]|nr:hypothetical protein [Desulfobacterium sp.]
MEKLIFLKKYLLKDGVDANIRFYIEFRIVFFLKRLACWQKTIYPDKEIIYGAEYRPLDHNLNWNRPLQALSILVMAHFKIL